MDNINYCTKKDRMIAFLIDRSILFPIWIVMLRYSYFMDLYSKLHIYIQNYDIVSALKTTILLPLLAYGYLLVIYFLYFVLLHLWFNNTIGKMVRKIQLKVLKNEKLYSANFKDLVKRYFLLYISGIGGFGYFYPFHKDKKSKYDDIVYMYVVEKK